MSTVVAVPYAALTTVQEHRPVLPHNSVWGLNYYAMGATCTQTRILLQMFVLSLIILHPQFRFHMHGRLDTMDYTAATLAASQP